MPGKRWCEYCRINLPYNKKDIQEHEETRLHLQNKQREIKFQRIKIQQEEKKKRQLSQQSALLSSANIPQAKKGSALDKQVQQHRQEIYSSGKAAIAQLIAERTQGKFGAPIQFPQKEELLIAQNFKHPKGNSSDEGKSNEASEDEQFQMWRIDICEQTGDPCFVNNLTKLKYYEPPKGYLMTEKQKQEWDYLKQICKQKVNEDEDNTVKISQWEEVPEEEDYFKMNQIVEEREEQSPVKEESAFKRPIASLNKGRQQLRDGSEPLPKTWKEELEERINSNQIDANGVMGTVIAHQLSMCRNLKEKNQTLKNLIKADIDIRQTAEQFNRKQTFQEGQQHQIVAFKPKKKVKTVKLTEESDMF